MLDTDQLRSFVAIVDTGSFTRAAERVNKTQSAVSMQIRRLEDQLGSPLFAKRGRGVRLTESGERLVDYARQMLQVEAAAFASISRRALAGRVRLGIPDDYADTLLPDLVTRFSRRHPLVELSVVCEHCATLVEQIAGGDLDVAIYDGEREMELLREEPLRWVIGANSRAHEVRPLPMALSNPTCSWRRAATSALDEAGIPWRALLGSTNSSAIAPVVQAGLAVTVMPLSAMRPGLKVFEDFEGLPQLPTIRIGMIESPHARSPEARALAEEIRAVFRREAPPVQPDRVFAEITFPKIDPARRARGRAAAA
ncbi:LysR substrate-binding domain-containing protein [Labrys wisconsinensis]|uniref:DNA-binding transcriptional LysR family regulator n=1 Tax=Labrys wisconsinensis TaxID=425677 RepID=A0ABU0JIL4_9HYPH|nr:LysR substrate-binding domain-containing protein [Labrys wisconsinensis]MDQ0473114.1 DNA-binding transcriptional LysR family regulator [Labrys wisconsinensis]